MTPRILLVSVGGGVSLAFARTLAPHRGRLQIIGVSTLAGTPAARLCDRLRIVAPVAEEERFVADLSIVMEAERPALALPCRDADLPALAAFKAVLPDLAAPLLVGTPAWAAAMSDKMGMARFCADHGLPMAPTVEGAEAAWALAAIHGYPLIAKPRFGSGTRGVLVLFGPAHLEASLSRGGNVFQPYVAPPPDLAALLPDPAAGAAFSVGGDLEDILAVRGVVGRDGGLVGSAFFALRHRFGQDHRAERLEMTDDALAIALAMARGLSTLGYAGPFGAQCRRDGDGRLVILELVSRLSGSIEGYAMMGWPEAALTVSLFAGIDLPSPAEPPLDVVDWAVLPVPPPAGVGAL